MSPATITHQAKELAQLTRELSRCCQAKEEQLLAKSGLSCAEGRVLLSIADRKFDMASVIAQHLGISRGRLSPLVENLVRKGFLTRAESAADRRSHHLVLTKAGQEVSKALATSQRSFHENLLLHFRPEERAALLATLEHLQAAMDDLRAQLKVAAS